jgi:hypothetical protein
MKRFYLDREVDDSGVSGVGRVAAGVCFETGECALCWIVGEIHSVTIYKSINEVQRIHSHGDHTKITWIDKDE